MTERPERREALEGGGGGRQHPELSSCPPHIHVHKYNTHTLYVREVRGGVYRCNIGI